MRKDVTPEKQNRKAQDKNQFVRNKRSNDSYMKRFGVSLLAGALGGMLVLGGYSVIDSTSNNSNKQQASETIKDTGKTKVQSTNVDLKTDVTEAVNKVSDAVVSVTTLQKQQTQLSDLERILVLLVIVKKMTVNLLKLVKVVVSFIVKMATKLISSLIITLLLVLML